MEITLIIPAYNPDLRLVTLINGLKAKNFNHIIVVDDGSIKECQVIFAQLYSKCLLYTHEKNLGKGAALKTGFSKALQKFPEDIGCITIDADGQHLPEDILKIFNALLVQPDNLILGSRNFTNSHVPFKSRWGNRITSAVFDVAAHKRCSDTQTGLRAIPMSLIPKMLDIEGQRYEYEMNMLLAVTKDNISFIEIPINTVYIDDNKSSHFRPFIDSLRIYKLIAKFGISSISSALIDILLFFIFENFIFITFVYKNLYSTILARIISGGLNFTLNKRFVFDDNSKNEPLQSKNTLIQSKSKLLLIKYFTLFFFQMFASYLLITLLENLTPLPIVFIKILSDSILFLFSFYVQKHIIFISGSEVN